MVVTAWLLTHFLFFAALLALQLSKTESKYRINAAVVQNPMMVVMIGVCTEICLTLSKLMRLTETNLTFISLRYTGETKRNEIK